MQRPNAADVRLDVSQLELVDLRQPLQAIREPAAPQLYEPRQLRLVHGNDELPPPAEGHAVLRAERLQLDSAFAAERRLQRSWRVIEPGVNDARVVWNARLCSFSSSVRCRPGAWSEQRQGGGESDDAASDDDYVRIHVVRLG